ncbi:LOW QUALITY PROTEIN: uncharacterized protein [Ciconia boyciana]|uniref:LOW QUALITY PROTEIN: uncharacterized protein n=1 Tax=Ciconia boyciana TaxID=52775 RepID=UPI003BA0ABC2
MTSGEVRSQRKSFPIGPCHPKRALAPAAQVSKGPEPAQEGLSQSGVGPGRPAQTRLGQARARRAQRQEPQQGRQGQAGKAGRAQEGAAWRRPPEHAASSMAGAEEVCTMPEQEREPEVTWSGGPSKGSEAKAKKSRSSRSSRAGLLFPVSRVDRQLRRGHFAERFGARAPVYLAAVLQWVTHKTMDVAGKISKKSKQQRISPSHLQMAVQKSSALRQLLRGGMPRRRGRAVPQSQRVASRSRKKATKSKKRCPTQRAAPARATAAVKRGESRSSYPTPARQGKTRTATHARLYGLRVQ